MISRTMCSCVALLMMVGCTEGQPTLLPGVELDGTPRASAVTRDAPQPCGYRSTYVVRAGGWEDITHERGRYAYNRANLQVLEERTEEATGELTFRIASDWNRREQIVHSRGEIPGISPYHFWYGYDRFGRLVHAGEDHNDDGIQERVTTYEYRRDGLRDTAVFSTPEGDRSITRYTYDDDDRLIRTETDTGLDGTVERSNVYAYDDEMRRTGITTIDATGAVLRTTALTYDDRDRVTSRATTEEWDGTVVQEERYRYSGDRLTQDTYTFQRFGDDGSIVDENIGTIDYQFGRCR